MWLTLPADLWTNPCGAIRLTPKVRAKYQAVYDDLQAQWYAAWPKIDSDPQWYERPNPPSALAYPPGFLKRDLDAVVFITGWSPDTDGYFWANDRVIMGIDSYERLTLALAQIGAPVDMLILSGECIQVPGDACGVSWRQGEASGFDAVLPPHVAALLREKIKATGLFVLGSCHSGNNPLLVQQMADVVGRPVAAAVGVCRGVRQELLCEGGIFWTLGGFAEGRAYTLCQPAGQKIPAWSDEFRPVRMPREKT
jgi:hypothetical protein